MENNVRGTYRDFEVQYKGNRILVRNEGDHGERLFVNGILQDQNLESDFGLLTGCLYNGSNITDRIEVRLKRNRVLECTISVNDEIIYSNVYSEEMVKKKKEQERGNDVYASQRKINRRMLIFLGIVSILILLMPYIDKVQQSLQR